MKLQELGLKQKPQTKYFEGGYVSFSTVGNELFYEVTSVKKEHKGSVDTGTILNKDQLDRLLSTKIITELVQWL